MNTKALKMCQMADKPLSSNALKKLKNLVTDGSNKRLRLQMLNLDERSMTSKRDIAWCSQRFIEVTTNKEMSFGGVPIVNWFGDVGQMGPIGDKDLHDPPTKTESSAKLAGYAIYRNFNQCVILTQTMRQGEDQIDLLNRLLRIRNGTLEQKDWLDINKRY